MRVTQVVHDDGRTVLLTRELPRPNAALTLAYWLGLERALREAKEVESLEISEADEPEPLL